MKLFQQFLLAPAALGLLAPVSISAAEINFNGISDYAPVSNQFHEGSEFSDIQPTDWTYKALSDIRNARGCNVSIPSGVITRPEAAILLNKCIGNAGTLNDVELRLVDEFSTELAAIKGTNQVLDTFAFEAGQFSPTTTLSGSANFVIGSVDGHPNEKTHNFYGYGLDLNTSFTGEDLLYSGLTQGNFSGLSGLADLDFAESDSTLTLSSFYYSFPVRSFAFTAGPLMDQDDVVSVTTSQYSDAWKLGGNPYTLPGTTGTGLGVSTEFGEGFNFAASYIAENGATPSKGIGSSESDDIVTAMIGYNGDSFGGGIIYTTLGEGSASTGYAAIGGGVYYSAEKYTLSFTWDSKDDEGSTENVEAWLLGSDISFGPGTLSAAMSNVPDSDTNDPDEMQYELYYSYPVSDNITVTPGFFHVEGDGGAADHTGIAVNTSFSF